MGLTPIRHRAFIEGFIKIYKNNPCLWQLSTPLYKCRRSKAVAYRKLLEYFLQFDQDANKSIVIRKIASLRSAFRKEHKKVKVSEVTSVSSEEIYKPQLWYYDMLSFVADQEEKKKEDRENGSDDDEVEFQDDHHIVKEEPFLPETEEVMLNAAGGSDDIDIEPGANYCTASSSSSFSRNANDAFGVFVAERLNKMNDQQRLLCEDLITQITSSAIKQKLTDNTRICDLPVSFNF